MLICFTMFLKNVSSYFRQKAICWFVLQWFWHNHFSYVWWKPICCCVLQWFGYPDPRRVWKGGSEQHLLTPLPRAPGANAKKLYVDVFYNDLGILTPGACGRGGLGSTCWHHLRGLRGQMPKSYMLLCFTTILLHKSQERYFFRNKKRLRQCITHTQGIQISGTSFFPKKSACGSASHTHRA